jgi:hypothetical protein
MAALQEQLPRGCLHTGLPEELERAKVAKRIDGSHATEPFT